MCISLSGGLYFSALATSNCHLAYCIGLVVCFLRATDRALYKTPTSLVSSRLHFPFSSPCLGLFHAIPRSAFEGFGALILGLPLDFDFVIQDRPQCVYYYQIAKWYTMWFCTHKTRTLGMIVTLWNLFWDVIRSTYSHHLRTILRIVRQNVY